MKAENIEREYPNAMRSIGIISATAILLEKGEGVEYTENGADNRLIELVFYFHKNGAPGKLKELSERGEELLGKLMDEYELKDPSKRDALSLTYEFIDGLLSEENKGIRYASA